MGATLYLLRMASLGEHGLQAHRPSCLLACGVFWDRESELCPLPWQVYSSPLHHRRGPPVGINVCLFTCDLLEGKVPFLISTSPRAPTIPVSQISMKFWLKNPRISALSKNETSENPSILLPSEDEKCWLDLVTILCIRNNKATRARAACLG